MLTGLVAGLRHSGLTGHAAALHALAGSLGGAGKGIGCLRSLVCRVRCLLLVCGTGSGLEGIGEIAWWNGSAMLLRLLSLRLLSAAREIFGGTTERVGAALQAVG